MASDAITVGICETSAAITAFGPFTTERASPGAYSKSRAVNIAASGIHPPDSGQVLISVPIRKTAPNPFWKRNSVVNPAVLYALRHVAVVANHVL